MSARRRAPRRALRVGGPFAILLLVLALAAVPADCRGQSFFPPASQPQRPSAAPINPEGEVLLRADEMIYDQNNEIVTASGDVQFSQGGRVLRADTVSYNQKTDIITASGHLAMIEPTGDTYFGEYAEITGDLKTALVRNFRGLLFDNSRIAANSVSRVAGERKEMVRGVFSPCSLCAEDPEKPPIWQIKAVHIIHDERAHEVIYRDATVEFFGTPIFYTPYLSHPDPSVKRESGFLSPTIGGGSNTGTLFSVPYFGIIDETSDFTVAPRFFSQEGVGLGLEYRKQFSNGFLRFAGSGLDARRFDDGRFLDQSKLRGNIGGNGVWNIDEVYRAGFDLARATDQTYLRRFRISNEFAGQSETYPLRDVLVSDAYLQGFDGRDYRDVRGFAFQSLRAFDIEGQIPRIHPDANYIRYFPTDAWGGSFRLASNILSYTRDIGASASRLANTLTYRLPTVMPGGHLITATGQLQLDGYTVDGQPTGSGPFSGQSGRAFPQLAVRWDYPLVRPFDSFSMVVQPTVQLVGGFNGGNPVEIPNLDSQSFELDETNIFALNRFPGYDRVSSGQRIDYGFSVDAFGGAANAPAGGFLFAQSLRAQTDSTVSVASGLRSRLSDVVGRIYLQPRRWLDLSYRFRIDAANFATRRNEVRSTFLFNWANFSISYFELRQSLNTIIAETTIGTILPPNQAIRAVSVSGAVPVTKYWTLTGGITRDFETESVQTGNIGIVYRDECFATSVVYYHDEFNNRDLRPSDTVLVRLGFKYLGDIGG